MTEPQSTNEPSVHVKWILLSNLKNNWLYTHNLTQEAADAALRWAEENGFASDGRITDAGKVWLLRH